MNTHTLQVFLYELRRNLRRKGYLFTTFGIPLIAAALLFGYQFITSLNNDSGSQDAAQQLAQQLNFQNVRHAGYVDLSGLFADPGDLSALLTRYPDEAAAQAALDNGAISLYYVIGQDYLETGDVLLVQPSLDISQIESAPIQRLVLNTLSEG
ncbi:MAG: hypothetical protein LC121_13665, partial [Anaerolineae bacterium]|nr:hypothetical protein [Anaerolineae bacterium]